MGKEFIMDPPTYYQSNANDTSRIYQGLDDSDYYEANAHLIAPKSRNIGADSQDDIEDTLNNFIDIAQATIKGLQTLGQVHPFVGVAVAAFVVVITMDIARRENDRKIMLVKLEMHDLMSVFFELRNVCYDPSKETGPSISHRLSGLMEEIARDIKACGSACDAISKKGILAKSIKSTKYEIRLAAYADKFKDHKHRLQSSFALHTALGVDDANSKLDKQDTRLDRIDDKLNSVISLFRRLETPRERDVCKFIDNHGGVQACLNDDKLLEELVLKSGESLSRISGRDTTRQSNDLPSIRKKLFKELAEDIDVMLSRNMVHFERKLEMQQKQLEVAIMSGTSEIKDILLSGSHDRINDADLQRIWKDMGWKGSVKARHFVLALHDYYTDKFGTRNSESLSEADRNATSQSKPTMPSPHNRSKSFFQRQDSTGLRRLNDKWALTYINAAYVQPILEAVDDDGTGFISIKEVNTFTDSCPEGWSLPHWIAYWAVGWQVNISNYKNKIYTVIQTMFQTLEHILPSNKRAVDEYLFQTSFWRIELLLRSTRSVNPKIRSDQDLMRIAETYATTEENDIKRNLESVNYDLDTPTTVTLVTGEGRIERYVFQLLYLLLRRHLQVFTLGCKHVLDVEELASLSNSLVTVLQLVDYRIQNLEAVFKQTQLDIQGRLGNFAFGMFQLSYGDLKRVPAQNSFKAWVDEDESNTLKTAPITTEEIIGSASSIPLSILKYGIQDGFSVTNYGKFEPTQLSHISHPLQGTWTGHCSRTHGNEVITYVIRVSFRLSEDQTQLLGKGEDFLSTFDVEGKVKSALRGYDFDLTLLGDDDTMTAASGFLDSDRDVLTMSWSDRRKANDPNEPFYFPFQLRRIQPSLLRYRYTPQQFAEDPIRSRWSFACDAALHEAQAKLWSRRFFKTRFNERRRFVELTTRSLIVSLGLTPQNPLNVAEEGELEYLRRHLNPSEARFYHTLSQFQIQKLPWHPAWGCDWCDRRITYSRMLCVQCMSEDLSDNIHLCATCVDKAPTTRSFVHNISHDMIKVEETLHDYHIAAVVESARLTIVRVKNVLRAIETGNHILDNITSLATEQAPTGLSSQMEVRPTCASCRRNIFAPCWACVICSQDTLICLDCEAKHRSPAPTEGSSASVHRCTHPMVLLRDTFKSGHNITTDDRLIVLQKRMNAIDDKVAFDLAALNTKVEERLASLQNHLESRLLHLETVSAQRFDTLEGLMRQLMANLGVRPPVNHVAQDESSFPSSLPTTTVSPLLNGRLGS